MVKVENFPCFGIPLILRQILEQRYAVSVRIPNYTELTFHTTDEHVGCFQEFKDRKRITIVLMLEKFPEKMRIRLGGSIRFDFEYR